MYLIKCNSTYTLFYISKEIQLSISEGSGVLALYFKYAHTRMYSIHTHPDTHT